MVAAVTGHETQQDHTENEEQIRAKLHFLWYNFKITLLDQDI